MLRLSSDLPINGWTRTWPAQILRAQKLSQPVLLFPCAQFLRHVFLLEMSGDFQKIDMLPTLRYKPTVDEVEGGIQYGDCFNHSDSNTFHHLPSPSITFHDLETYGLKLETLQRPSAAAQWLHRSKKPRFTHGRPPEKGRNPACHSHKFSEAMGSGVCTVARVKSSVQTMQDGALFPPIL